MKIKNTIERKKLNWALIEQPTYNLRGKIAYNMAKSLLLGNSHDPSLPQIPEFIDSIDKTHFSDINQKPLDRRTVESWASGNKQPGPKHRQAFNRMCESLGLERHHITQWFESTSIGTPLLRHLHALDSRLLMLMKKM